MMIVYSPATPILFEANMFKSNPKPNKMIAKGRIKLIQLLFVFGSIPNLSERMIPQRSPNVPAPKENIPCESKR